jgi:hypothetical protein
VEAMAEILRDFNLANRGKKLGDLVGVHAGCRDLDWTSPVEVAVAKIVSELLEDSLVDLGVVVGDVVVSGLDAALGRGLGHQVKVVVDEVVLALNYP